MAGDEAQHEVLMDKLDGLVQDESKVVSFKWLSREFSISSNRAKEVLQRYSEKSSGALEVAYLVSGWTIEEPRGFSIRLASSSTLEGVKASLEAPISWHVYSVQRSLPKDPAGLWTTEFVQSEGLFTQPPEVDNCLRDNRFSAVSFSGVKRDPKGRQTAIPSSANPPAALPSKPSKPVPSALDPGQDRKAVAESRVNEKSSAKSSHGSGAPTNEGAEEQINPREERTKVGVGVVVGPGKAMGGPGGSNLGGGVKRKAPAVVGTGKGNALSSMWKKAANKKPAHGHEGVPAVHVPAKSASVSLAGNADAEIRALEDELSDGLEDSDNEAADFAVLRSGKVGNNLGGASGRRRRMIEDEEEEDETAELVLEHTGGEGQGKKGEMAGQFQGSQDLRTGANSDDDLLTSMGSEQGGVEEGNGGGMEGIEQSKGEEEELERGSFVEPARESGQVETKQKKDHGTHGQSSGPAGGTPDKETRGQGLDKRQVAAAEEPCGENKDVPVAMEGVEGPASRTREQPVEILGQVTGAAGRREGGSGGGRKKMIKTIDNRGKEMTKIVYVDDKGEIVEPGPAAAPQAAPAAPEQKQSAYAQERASKGAPAEKPATLPSGGGGKAAVARGGSKAAAKLGGKGGQQKGNIMSFFKPK